MIKLESICLDKVSIFTLDSSEMRYALTPVNDEFKDIGKIEVYVVNNVINDQVIGYKLTEKLKKKVLGLKNFGIMEHGGFILDD
jgi:hypothetical protein